MKPASQNKLTQLLNELPFCSYTHIFKLSVTVPLSLSLSHSLTLPLTLSISRLHILSKSDFTLLLILQIIYEVRLLELQYGLVHSFYHPPICVLVLYTVLSIFYSVFQSQILPLLLSASFSSLSRSVIISPERFPNL